MEISKIHTAMDKACSDLIDKGYTGPNAYIQVENGGRLYARASAMCMSVSKDESEFCDSVDEAITFINRWIKDLETVEVQMQRDAVKKFGNSIDALRAAGISADFVDPLSDALQAMTENLLPAPKEEEMPS